MFAFDFSTFFFFKKISQLTFKALLMTPVLLTPRKQPLLWVEFACVFVHL